MKKILIAIVALSFLLPVSLSAQLELPKSSPGAAVLQRVGLTEIEVDYGSPAVKDREIWGKLIPFGKLWRTGANEATIISFTTDVNILGNEIPAGKYTLLSIPNEDEWTFIINEDITLVGTANYDEEFDVARFKVKPTAGNHRERLTFLFENTTNQETTLVMEWAKLRMEIPIKVETHEMTMDVINTFMSNHWRNYARAAHYTLEAGEDLDQGLTWIAEAIALQEDYWYNYWIQAQLYNAKGDNKKAKKAAQTAKKLGDKASNFFYKDKVEKALKEW